MKNALITGGNGDIAKAIITELENLGKYNIYAPDRYSLDVTDSVSISRYFEDKVFDIVINNAGYIETSSIIDSSYDNFSKTIMINLTGAFAISNQALKKNPRTYIINIGSSAATKVHAEWSAYCASKAAIVMATKCWYEEGIKTICLSPGRTATKMRSSLFQKEDPTTLLKPSDFAKVVINAIYDRYELGTNIDVNINTIGELLK